MATGRPPLWRDVRVVRFLLQAAFLAAIVAVVWWLFGNLTTNMARSGLPRTFDYLEQPAGFAIPETDFSSGASFLVALRYGAWNTFVVSGIGIVLATLIGIVVGIARLSSNWLVRKTAAVYVESLRNIPVLLIIIFWWLAVLLELPPSEAGLSAGGLFLSNRGLAIPSVTAAGTVAPFVAGLGLAVAGAAVVWVWRTRHNVRTGEPHHRVLWAFIVFLALAVVTYLVTGSPVAATFPERGNFGPVGGQNLSIEFAALLIGLTIYTASHIAEIVRGSILAVPTGQAEAATALGLTGFQRMRFVVLPQAFRIMVPPLSNQFLNLTKNSSLGVAVGYYEMTRITFVTISQGGPAPQAIALLMVFYLAFSLTISAAANLVNRRLLGTV